MKKVLNKIRSFIFFTSIIFSVFSFQNAQASNWSVFIGAGELYNPSSYRIGIQTWEFGILSNRTFGVIKNVPLGNYYISFGPAYVADTLGFFGAAGMNYQFWKFLYLKGELNASRSISNDGIGTMMVGIGAAF